MTVSASIPRGFISVPDKPWSLDTTDEVLKLAQETFKNRHNPHKQR